MAEERYDVLDEHGHKTGQVLPKSEVHEKELWHASAFVWIYNDKGEVLLQLRDKNKKSFPGLWDVSVAGHISAGDSPELTAVRETEEEIGIKISESELEKVEYTYDIAPYLPNKKHPEFCWVYILHKNLELKDLKIAEGEVTDVRLINVDQLLREFRDTQMSKVYAARNPLVYETALEVIKKKLLK